MKHRFILTSKTFVYFYRLECSQCFQLVMIPKPFVRLSLVRPHKNDAEHYEMLVAGFPICTPI